MTSKLSEVKVMLNKEIFTKDNAPCAKECSQRY